MELYQSLSSRFPEELSPLIRSILKECCNNAENSVNENVEYAVFLSFKMCIIQLKAIVEALSSEADVINLNYDNQTFQISQNSIHWKQLLLIYDQLKDFDF